MNAHTRSVLSAGISVSPREPSTPCVGTRKPSDQQRTTKVQH